MRIIVCAVILMIPYNITSLTALKEVDRECDSDSECLPSLDCKSYQDQKALLKLLTDPTSKSRFIGKLKKQVCNRKERGICCSSPIECGKSQAVPSNVSFGD